ncbi:Serine/threonine-protein kinase mph1 [Hordeum vulgare]|nr:Serine/threonine-protein kinase mph1 [Hordeum vulgare]
MSSPRILFGERPTPTPTPTVEDSLYNQFMENVIYEGHGEAFEMGGHGDDFDPEETKCRDGRSQFVADEDFEADDHDDSWHEDDGIYCEGEGDEEEEGINIVGEPLFINELTQRADAQKWKKSICTGSYSEKEDKLICESWMEVLKSLEAFKARHNGKPFTLSHCWRIINNFPKFKDQYRELERKRGKKTAALAEGGVGEALKRPRGKTNSKMDDKRDVASFALHETLHGMMSQKEARDEKKRQGKEEKMKQFISFKQRSLRWRRRPRRGRSTWRRRPGRGSSTPRPPMSQPKQRR